MLDASHRVEHVLKHSIVLTQWLSYQFNYPEIHELSRGKAYHFGSGAERPFQAKPSHLRKTEVTSSVSIYIKFLQYLASCTTFSSSFLPES